MYENEAAITGNVLAVFNRKIVQWSMFKFWKRNKNFKQMEILISTN